MISIPSNDPNTAIRILSSVSRFAVLSEVVGMRDWLKSELARLDAANRRELDEVTYRQRQGACQLLESLFAMAETADETVEKIRANQRKP